MLLLLTVCLAISTAFSKLFVSVTFLETGVPFSSCPNSIFLGYATGGTMTPEPVAARSV